MNLVCRKEKPDNSKKGTLLMRYTGELYNMQKVFLCAVGKQMVMKTQVIRKPV